MTGRVTRVTASCLIAFVFGLYWISRPQTHMPGRSGAPNVTPTKKARIRDRYELGQTQTEIAHDLGISQSTVSKVLDRLRKNPDPYAQAEKSGTPRLLDERDLRRARRAINSGECKDGADVQRNHFPHVSMRTIRRNLAEIGLHGFARRSVPYLTKKHIAARHMYAKTHVEWTAEDWQKVWFSDESVFKLTGSDGRRYCRRPKGQAFDARYVQPLKTGSKGKVAISGFVTYDGVGPLFRVNGNMKADQYITILEQGLLAKVVQEDQDIGGLIWVHDNASNHTARIVKKWLSEHNINCMDWPPKSPDQNIIENLWHYLDIRVRIHGGSPRTADELWGVLEREWYKIPLDVIRNLYNSIPCRLMAMKKAKGKWTKY